MNMTTDRLYVRPLCSVLIVCCEVRIPDITYNKFMKIRCGCILYKIINGAKKFIASYENKKTRENWIQYITFAVKTNAADTHGSTHNTFSAR